MQKMENNSDPTYGYYKVAAASFPVVLGDPEANAKKMVELIEKAVEENVQFLVFPELSLTGYTCADMFLHKELYTNAEYALRTVKSATSGNTLLVCVGMPIEEHGKLFNCAVYLQSNEIKGIVPKTYIPNYGEFYEKRWFVSSSCRTSDTIKILGNTVPFSENLILHGDNDVLIGTEICEDLWVDSPPSGLLSRAGATVIVNPSASNDLIGKREYRRNLVKMQSGRCRAGYVYASAGEGESSTDLVFSGHCIIAENGRLVNEGRDEMVIGLIDIEKCINDRRRFNSDVWEQTPEIVESKIFVSSYPIVLPDYVDPYPFVPSKADELTDRCDEIMSLQVRGLMQRLKATGMEHVVLGISGGLDSTLAMLVCLKAFDKLGITRKNIHCITMPGFGTSSTTKNISDDLMEAAGVSSKTIDITNACKVHLNDLGHPLDVYDIAYENVQARERTQILFDYANMVNGLVIGTGDMSELALGWCTYNGDHMSNYGVNVGVPKTLVRYLVANSGKAFSKDLHEILLKVCDLPISPELLPTDENGNIAQKTEDSIGKYDLHDFFMYHYVRDGFGYDKIFMLATIAYPEINKDEIKSTLDIFFKRFRTQQFKRSCIPDGVKVGTVSLSPRGDLRLPSDLAKLL